MLKNFKENLRKQRENDLECLLIDVNEYKLGCYDEYKESGNLEYLSYYQTYCKFEKHVRSELLSVKMDTISLIDLLFMKFILKFL